MARNVGSLFYTAPGVDNSGGTGTANPSIGGATGLENQYIADGVNITDGGYGGMGVYSPIYGSLGTGINLTFIQEVQVKTGAFEPKYGKGDGGISPDCHQVRRNLIPRRSWQPSLPRMP